jgi:hypothetical protein
MRPRVRRLAPPRWGYGGFCGPCTQGCASLRPGLCYGRPFGPADVEAPLRWIAPRRPFGSVTRSTFGRGRFDNAGLRILRESPNRLVFNEFGKSWQNLRGARRFRSASLDYMAEWVCHWRVASGNWEGACPRQVICAGPASPRCNFGVRPNAGGQACSWFALARRQWHPPPRRINRRSWERRDEVHLSGIH